MDDGHDWSRMVRRNQTIADGGPRTEAVGNAVSVASSPSVRPVTTLVAHSTRLAASGRRDSQGGDEEVIVDGLAREGAGNRPLHRFDDLSVPGPADTLHSEVSMRRCALITSSSDDSDIEAVSCPMAVASSAARRVPA
ncbi:hypothetical protein REQ_09580 [Prescottella equi 103S]|uniref:Uncharacterized protein n=1 Tax=Rhodococcus hoagii (strain 103S) TaxID=685727 RepID=A0A3S5Y3G9_RHOH1|nr:hypothetical protein REQ_09580 [Prescottella equi 103S]